MTFNELCVADKFTRFDLCIILMINTFLLNSFGSFFQFQVCNYTYAYYTYLFTVLCILIRAVTKRYAYVPKLIFFTKKKHVSDTVYDMNE